MIVEQYAAFIAEDSGMPAPLARRLASFIMKANESACIDTPVLFTKHGKARCYFETPRQNKMPAIMGLENCYFDAECLRIFFVGDHYIGKYRMTPDQVPHFMITGAKNRKTLKAIAEVEAWARNL